MFASTLTGTAMSADHSPLPSDTIAQEHLLSESESTSATLAPQQPSILCTNCILISLLLRQHTKMTSISELITRLSYGTTDHTEPSSPKYRAHSQPIPIAHSRLHHRREHEPDGKPLRSVCSMDNVENVHFGHPCSSHDNVDAFNTFVGSPQKPKFVWPAQRLNYESTSTIEMDLDNESDSDDESSFDGPPPRSNPTTINPPESGKNPTW